jgi:hypothetical protein
MLQNQYELEPTFSLVSHGVSPVRFGCLPAIHHLLTSALPRSVYKIRHFVEIEWPQCSAQLEELVNEMYCRFLSNLRISVFNS